MTLKDALKKAKDQAWYTTSRHVVPVLTARQFDSIKDRNDRIAYLQYGGIVIKDISLGVVTNPVP